MVKATSIALGMQAIWADMGIEKDVTIYTDSIAAKGTATRRGLGKVRHIEVKQLSLQQKIATGDIKVNKVSE